MTKQHTKRTKEDMKQVMHLTRPPRLEGAVKEAMMQTVRKPKSHREKMQHPRKPRGFTERQRKDFQLRNKGNG